MSGTYCTVFIRVDESHPTTFTLMLALKTASSENAFSAIYDMQVKTSISISL
jgi:hypothetical protein